MVPADQGHGHQAAPGCQTGWMDRPVMQRLRGTTGLFLFAMLGLGSAAVATRVVAGADPTGPLVRAAVTVSADTVPSTVTVQFEPLSGVQVREIRVRDGDELLARLLSPPYVYLAVDLPPGRYPLAVDVDDARGTTAHVVVVEVPARASR
jgi:hypothetical protein